MGFEQIVPAVVVVALCFVSGLADAQGFLHASRIWQADRLLWPELGKSAFGFSAGIGSYWLSLRFMQRLGIAVPEVQTAIWFAVTIISLAVASGSFSKWPVTDQFVACFVLVGLGWLLIRSGSC